MKNKACAAALIIMCVMCVSAHATLLVTEFVADGPPMSPITGYIIDNLSEDSFAPVAVCLPNNAVTRRGESLRDADIIYEAAYNTVGVTSFLAIYESEKPRVYPLRELRAWQHSIIAEWQCATLFAGYGEDKPSISKTIKKLLSDYFDSPKSNTAMALADDSLWVRSPNNITADTSAYGVECPTHAYRFTDTPLMGDEDALQIVVKHNDDYAASYTYDEATRRYIRNDVQGLAVSNVVVQYAPMAERGLPFITAYNLVGEGDAEIFIDGMVIHGRWKRASEDAMTHFFDGAGDEIEFLRGKTVVHILWGR